MLSAETSPSLPIKALVSLSSSVLTWRRTGRATGVPVFLDWGRAVVVPSAVISRSPDRVRSVLLPMKTSVSCAALAVMEVELIAARPPSLRLVTSALTVVLEVALSVTSPALTSAFSPI